MQVLNFSIAYGKTAHGLSKDWKVTLQEAEDTVNRWYGDRKEVSGRGVLPGIGRAGRQARQQGGVHSTWRAARESGRPAHVGQPVGRECACPDGSWEEGWLPLVAQLVLLAVCCGSLHGHQHQSMRPLPTPHAPTLTASVLCALPWLPSFTPLQVREWQKDQRQMAQTKGYVTTILGRRRQLPDASNSRNRAAQGHALRAAINTPIQGSAADIATAAMLRIAVDQELADMGWRLLLQVGWWLLGWLGAEGVDYTRRITINVPEDHN